MLHLSNNCRASAPSVFPSNWQTCDKSSLNDTWYISYYFYDDNIKKSKKVILKGFTRYKKLSERREAVAIELELLKKVLNLGFNPFFPERGTSAPLVENPTINITPYSILKDALEYGMRRYTKTVSQLYYTNELSSIYAKILKTIHILHIERTPLKDITLKPLFNICEIGGIKENGEFSRDKFNRCRKFLITIYDQLIPLEAVTHNIPKMIKPQKKEIANMRKVLSVDERKRVFDYLKGNNRHFWLYLNCFYHSGARNVEMLKLKGSDVDFENQRLKFTMLKGRTKKEIYRPMPDIAVKYWREALQDCAHDHYVFSTGLKPGQRMVSPAGISNRWREHVKNTLGIEADFYSIKHLKVTELIEEIGIDGAALQMGELAATLRRHYDIKNDERSIITKKAGKEFDK